MNQAPPYIGLEGRIWTRKMVGILNAKGLNIGAFLELTWEV